MSPSGAACFACMSLLRSFCAFAGPYYKYAAPLGMKNDLAVSLVFHATYCLKKAGGAVPRLVGIVDQVFSPATQPSPVQVSAEGVALDVLDAKRVRSVVDEKVEPAIDTPKILEEIEPNLDRLAQRSVTAGRG